MFSVKGLDFHLQLWTRCETREGMRKTEILCTVKSKARHQAIAAFRFHLHLPILQTRNNKERKTYLYFFLTDSIVN